MCTGDARWAYAQTLDEAHTEPSRHAQVRIDTKTAKSP